MILSGKEIKRQIANGNIVISDFDEKRLNPNSYNLRLHKKLLVYEDDYFDLKEKSNTKELFIPKEGLILQPNELYLGSTIEYTETKNFVPCLEGRSSLARLGVKVHFTAGFGDVGFCGNWTLEISVTKPTKIYSGFDFCQIYYQTILGDFDLYTGRYNNSEGVGASKSYM